jgi:pilin isopeptide linkage protein
MKRNISKVLAIVVTLALVMSFAAVSASAVTYTAANGTDEFEFNKYLVVDSDSQIPDAEFTFNVVAGTAVPGGADNALEIKAGPDADQIVIDSAVFTLGQSTTAGTPDDETDTTAQYATAAVGIDLTGVTFTAPGVYRYVITEVDGQQNGFTYDNSVRYLDVFVFPSEADPTALEVTGYSLRDAATNFERVLDQETGEYKYQYETNPNVKTDNFTNEYEDVDLEFTKAITGNQADKTKKFAFTLELTDVNPGSYALEITGDNVVDTESTNVSVDADTGVYTITVGDSGSVTETFYLTDGDVVKVLGLPVGYSYTLTEDAEEYDSTASTVTGYTDDTADTDVQSDVKTSFTNDRTGIIPTGVIIMIAPFAIGLLVFGAIILYVMSKRRRVAY